MVMSHLCDEMWALVTVYFRDQKIGLYRARHVEGNFNPAQAWSGFVPRRYGGED